MTNALAGQKLSRPTREVLIVGPAVLPGVLSEIAEGFTLVTQPEPRRSLEMLDDGKVSLSRAGTVLEALDLSRESLEALVAAATPRGAVVGVGGGVVMDSAKWLANCLGSSLTLAPSILSVDACVTNTIAVRDDGKVVYKGFVEADRIVLDTEIVRRAPSRLNRAGVGDLLSIHTALFDWAAGETNGGAVVYKGVARLAATVLDRIDALADAIAEVADEALYAVLEGYAEINDLTVAKGHAQMEEGSEHYLAYCLEEMTKRAFVHGEIVTLGTVIMSRLQGNNPERPLSIAERAGVEWHPMQLGLTRADLSTALLRLRDFVMEARLPYSIANRPIDEALVEMALDGLA